MVDVVKCCSVILLLFGACVAEWKTYEGYKSFALRPRSTRDIATLTLLQNKYPKHIDFDFIPTRPGSRVHVVTSPVVDKSAVQLLESMSTRTIDVHKYVSAEKQKQIKRFSRPDVKFDLNQYNNFTQIMAQLDVWKSQCPAGLECTTYDVGQSIEGRPMRMFKISNKTGLADRKAFWADSLIHSREWLAGATLFKIINHFIVDHGSDHVAAAILAKYDWYFLPVMNPDGYEYTWTTERLWRKNRRIGPDECDGIDLNRNYDQRWDYVNGASTDHCSQIYKGPSAASEPETVATQNEGLFVGGGGKLRAWLSYHTTATSWLIPYGNLVEDDEIRNECEETPDNAKQMQVAQAAAEATSAVNGLNYGHGNSCRELTVTSATTKDWAYAKGGAKHSFTMELNGISFEAPPESIEPSYTEAWAGLKAMITEIETVDGP